MLTDVKDMDICFIMFGDLKNSPYLCINKKKILCLNGKK